MNQMTFSRKLYVFGSHVANGILCLNVECGLDCQSQINLNSNQVREYFGKSMAEVNKDYEYGSKSPQKNISAKFVVQELDFLFSLDEPNRRKVIERSLKNDGMRIETRKIQNFIPDYNQMKLRRDTKYSAVFSRGDPTGEHMQIEIPLDRGEFIGLQRISSHSFCKPTLSFKLYK